MGAAKRFTQNPGRNAICYYRYSSDAQRDASIEQKKKAIEYAHANKLTIIKEYADRAVSGTRDDRAQYNLMMYEVAKLKPAYLILWKTDRLSRDRYDSVIAKKKLDPEAPIADYWLLGHLFCGNCGEGMQGISGTGKTNKTHYYYSCKGHRQHRCDARNKPKDLVERVVLHALDGIVHDPAYRLAIADACYERYLRDVDDGGAMEDAIRAQLHDTETALANIMKAIEAGIFNTTTGKRMEELEATRDRLEQAKKQCRLTPQIILKYLDDLDDPQARDRILDEYVVRILVILVNEKYFPRTIQAGRDMVK